MLASSRSGDDSISMTFATAGRSRPSVSCRTEIRELNPIAPVRAGGCGTDRDLSEAGLTLRSEHTGAMIIIPA
ncbi:hypothetical protein [Microlunatus sp. GCM10028923]|uniref:hypothetical protein n=1 Tax=Microlunatus sp. GCM10028923 TaxID=3273400 RepID=UPI0036071DBF